jgi:polysaccharide export outer membrane protein
MREAQANDVRQETVVVKRSLVRNAGRIGLGALACTLVVFSSGCAFAPGMHVNVDPKKAVEGNYRIIPVTSTVLGEQRAWEQTRAAAMRTWGLPVQDPAAPTREYRIGPGDVLAVTVWEHPELSNPYGEKRAAGDGIEVGVDGRVFFPYAGLTKVSGLTLDDVRALLTRKLGVIARSPQVDVRVVAFRSQRVYITGEVVQPGVVALDTAPKGLIEALAERGGLNERASRRRIYLSRGKARYEIDLRRIYGGELGAVNLALKSGDVIRVPDTSEDQVLVLGEVTNPRAMPLPGETLSALSAIAEAGGVSRLSARGSDIYVFRASDSLEPDRKATQVYQIDMRKPQGMLFATHFELRPRDVVYVASTGLSKYNSVVQQLLPSLQEIFYIDRIMDRSR